METGSKSLGMTLQHSLASIQAAQTQFSSLASGLSTSTSLLLQIKLCEILLSEIHVIRLSLEEGRSAGTAMIVLGPAPSSHTLSNPAKAAV